MKITYKNKRSIFLFGAIALFCLAYAVERPTIAYTIKEQVSPTEKNDFKEENILSTKQDKNLVTSQLFSGLDTTTDSDGDGVPDHLDLDSDNDGIPDCVENGFEGLVSNYFQLKGDAAQDPSSPYEIILTPNSQYKYGQAWSKGQVDFTQSFQLRFQAYLGTNNSPSNPGADGMAIVFQNSPKGRDAVGAVGGGLGAEGIANGIALELDTYANTGAPHNDPYGSHGHGHIWRTSDYFGYTTPMPLGNLKDGKWYDVEVTWNVETQNLSYKVNGTTAGSRTFTNIVTEVFGGASRVYFGYTASTGLYYNLQKVRFVNPCIDLPLTLDTDGDGIPDYLDLDSDNDGCPDAIEGDGNISQSQLDADGRIIGEVDDNGIPNFVNGGQGIGQSKNATDFSACCPSDVSGWLDSDGDGISDRCDLDDDNDGILDAVESPECYYNVNEANRIQSVVSFFDGNTGFPSAGNDLEVLRNEIEEPDGATCFRFGASQTVAPGNPIFTVEYPVAIVLSSISVVKSTGGITTASGYGKLYGSNDGITYDLLTSGNGVSLTTSGTLIFSNSNTTAYKYYQIRFIGTAAAGNSTSGTISATTYLREITSIVSSAVPYIPSAHPKPGPCTADTDGDEIPNHLDLDSDGDGCPDAIEGDENVEQSHLNTNGSINIDANGGIDANGVPNMVNSGGAADVGGDQGQGVGNSKNSNINDCPFPDVCTTGNCNGNAFLNTDDPNTLEYDNLISGFHATIAKKQDGSYLIWGQGASPKQPDPSEVVHLYEPTPITYENGFEYTGDILKATLGTHGVVNGRWDHYAILTTDGLYIWGGGAGYNAMVHSSVKGTRTFDKMTDANITNANEFGLPDEVEPEDVKMLFGSYATLGIVTCDGAAYVLSYLGNKNGDGTTDDAVNRKMWHRVHVSAGVPLNRIVAMRGVTGAMVALTSEGELYTWGSDTYLGDGSPKADRLYATKMSLPAGVKPKMIGMTKASAHNSEEPYRNNSYYLLSTTGDLYALGDNTKKQLGAFLDPISNPDSKYWVRVKATEDTYMSNIKWISPNEHDNAGFATVTALTGDGKLWGWGANSRNMLGHGSYEYVDPRYMFGGLDENDKILAVETGGHINTIFKDCEYKLGYIGHNINGSYATSDNDDTHTPDFKFDGAKFSDLCAIPLPPYPEVIDLKACPGSTFDLMDALQNTVPTGYNLQWWTSANREDGVQIIDVSEMGEGTYYAFFMSNGSDCPLIVGEEVVLSYYGPTDEEYESCVCFRDPVITGLGSETQVGISLIKGRETLQSSDNWPKSRKSGFIALESNKQGMVVTRIATTDLVNITSPQEGMMVYDTTEKCLKIYSDGQWKCFTKPACP